MTTLHDISTPSLVLDVTRLLANCEFMAARAKQLGVRLRPHMKTAKSADVARVATAGQFGGITVSTLAEAEYFFAHGFNDITLAVGFLPDRLPRALALVRQGAALQILTDSEAAAKLIAAGAADVAPHRLGVLIEVDCGDRRGGVDAAGDELLAIARAMHGMPGVQLAGVLTHGGHSYRCTSIEEIQAVARHERDSVALAAQRLRAAGLPCETASVGSTPTCTHAQDFAGCTEMRPGVYMLGDLDQVGLESLPAARVAATVLCSVIGVYPDQNKLIVDAGGLALSKDASAQRHGEQIGYGLVLDIDGKPLRRIVHVEGTRTGSVTKPVDAWVFAASQEHGQITAADPLPFEKLKVGARLRILPNHICMTAAAHPGFYVVEGGGEVVAQWGRVNGWGNW